VPGSEYLGSSARYLIAATVIVAAGVAVKVSILSTNVDSSQVAGTAFSEGAQQSQARVELVGWNVDLHAHGGDFIAIEGSLKNVGTETADDVKGSVTLTDSNGQIVQSARIEIDKSTLKKDETTTFKLTVKKQPGAETPNLSLYWQ
jgi:hypothetical protein